MKALHDIASMGFGGALAACLVINLVAQPASATEFAAIAQYVPIPSMAVVLISGLIALAATCGHRDAGGAC